jgi:hypothetical protein
MSLSTMDGVGKLLYTFHTVNKKFMILVLVVVTGEAFCREL